MTPDADPSFITRGGSFHMQGTSTRPVHRRTVDAVGPSAFPTGFRCWLGPRRVPETTTPHY